MNSEISQKRRAYRRIAAFALAGATAGIMLLPAGQGVAGATAVPTGVSHVAGEKPVLGCGDRWCGNGWGRRWCGGWRCHGHHHRHHRHHDHYYEHDFHSGDRHHRDHVEPAPERAEQPVEPVEPPVKDGHKPIKDDHHKEDPFKWDFHKWSPFGDENYG
uniref:Uncharacterized protein n=2 Tax=Nonomuraea gerenzanensis TaxID=93944 RepID=A0A1M4EJQ6_9ACTN|nr:hypothetical protein BN4615_P8598 [Nonomuraea gerenzanensis]